MSSKVSATNLPTKLKHMEIDRLKGILVFGARRSFVQVHLSYCTSCSITNGWCKFQSLYDESKMLGNLTIELYSRPIVSSLGRRVHKERKSND